MNLTFRRFNKSDRDLFSVMVRKFYAPPAVLHFPPEEVMMSCFDAALEIPELVYGFIFEADGETAGYAIVSIKFESGLRSQGESGVPLPSQTGRSSFATQSVEETACQRRMA